jgi:protein associated with RNAse G/E
LIAAGSSGTSTFYELDDEEATPVDVITPPRWSERTVSMVDLDLDVVRHRDGRVEIVDLDEFEQHRRSLSYPHRLARAALEAAAALAASFDRQDEPYASVGWEWLAAARSIT